MHFYSNWLIDVKNRANLRQARPAPERTSWRGNVSALQEPQDEGQTLVCRILSRRGYKLIKKIGEGTFSEVVKTQSLKDGKFYACKTMKQTINSLEQANNLREVQAMKRLGPHANIVQLHELIYNKDSGTVSLVCELMEMNIYEFIQGRRSPLPEQTVKLYMFQLCRSLEHMHRCGIFHRDVKPENILIRQNVLKLGDFGSCRSVYSRPPHTEYISTRWYRAPECLLTDGYYSLKMDLWSAGCVFFEIMSLNPLFPGTNEVDQISKIHDVLGTPEPSVLRKLKQSRSIQFNFTPRKGSGLSRLIPNCPAPALSLLYQMLAYDADERITADTALRHTYFTDRLVEKKSESFSRQEGAAQSWGPTRTRGRHARQTPLHNKHVSHYTTHLPRLSLPQTSSSSEPGLTVTHTDSLPAITKRSVVKVTTGRREEASSLSLQPRDESRRDVFTGFLLPPLERKHGGS